MLSAIRFIAHSDKLPIPKPPNTLPKLLEKSLEIPCVNEFKKEAITNRLHLITQPKLNNLVRYLNLTINQLELSIATVKLACFKNKNDKSA